MDAIVAENPRAVIGGNNPPEKTEPTPFEKAQKVVNDIYNETMLWLDGNPIDSQELADGVGNLLGKIREAEKLANDARKDEKAELDVKVAEIQARYAPLIADTKSVKGKTVLATAACKAALEPWLKKVAAELEAKAKREREEADAKLLVAQQAIRTADPTNLAERENAETLLRDAKKADTSANKTARQTATAGGSMGARAIGLRTVTVVAIDDPIAFGRWAWANHRGEYEVFMQGLAERLVRGGALSLPGIKITEEKGVV